MEELEKYRRKIGEIDEKFIELLAKRFELAKKIGKYKKEKGIAFFDQSQFDTNCMMWQKLAEESDIDKDLALNIYKLIHKYLLKSQEGL